MQPSNVPFTDEDFATAARETASLLPAVGRAALTRTFNGLMSFTPDGFPLLGETASVRGLWLGEAIWVTHSGGAGKALAELMTHGDASVDLHEADPERYDNHGLSRPYARARGAQGYREVYDIIHPRQQSEQARGLRRTPFYEREAGLGARFFESAGWERPQWYEANAALLGGTTAATGRRRSGRRATGRRSRWPSTSPAASGSACSTSRRSRRSRSAGRAPAPTCSASPRTTSTARSGRSSTRRCSARAPGSCAT